MKKNRIKIIAGLLVSVFLSFAVSFAAGAQTNLSPALEINKEGMMNAFWGHNPPRILSVRDIGQFNPEAVLSSDHRRITFGDTFYAYGTLRLDRKLGKDDVENLFSLGIMQMGVWTSSSAKRGDKVKVVEVRKDGKRLWARPWIELKKKKLVVDIAEGIQKAAKALAERHMPVRPEDLREQLLDIIKTPMLTEAELSELLQTVTLAVEFEGLEKITADDITRIMQETAAYHGQRGNEFRLECEVIPLEIPAYPDAPERNGIMEFSVYFNPRNPQSSDDFYYTTKWKKNAVMEIVPLSDVVLSLQQRRDFYEHLWQKYRQSTKELERIEILGILLFYAVEQKDDYAEKILDNKIKNESPATKKQFLADLATFNMDDIMPFLTPLLTDQNRSVFDLALQTLRDVREKHFPEKGKDEGNGLRQRLRFSMSEMAFDFSRQRYLDMSAGKERIKYLIILMNHALVKKNKHARRILNGICQSRDPEVRKRFAEDLKDFEAREISGFLYQLLHDKNSDVRAAAQHTYRELERELYLQGVAHHIRNKLVIVGGYSRRLLKKLEKQETDFNNALATAAKIVELVDELEKIIFKEYQYISALTDNSTINMAVASLVSKISQPMEEIGELLGELGKDKGIERLKDTKALMDKICSDFDVIPEMTRNLKKTVEIEQIEPVLKRVELNEFLVRCRDNFKKEFKAEDAIIQKEMSGFGLTDDEKETLGRMIKEQLKGMRSAGETTNAAVSIIKKARAAGITQLNNNLQQVRTMLQTVIRARDIEVEFTPTGTAIEAIISDEFEGVIKEMLGNAVKARAQKIKITVEKKSLDKVEISIEDDGVGMGAYERLFAFSPFFTTETYTKSFTLRRIKQVLDSYGGKISLFSEKNGMVRGTEFVIELPAMSGNEITVAEIIRLQRKLRTVLQGTDRLLAISGAQESGLVSAQKDAETKIMRDYRESGDKILEEIERYERGDVTFNVIMKKFKDLRGDFVTKYGILEEISDTEENIINLKNSAAEAMDIFLGILVSASRSTENCSIVEVINEVTDFYRPRFESQKGEIILDFSGIEKAGLKDKKVFLPKTALRKILSDFLFAAHEKGVSNAAVNVSLDNRQLKIEANIRGKTLFDGNRFLLREKESVNIANGLAKIAVLPDGELVFSLWLPIKTDIKTLPCRQFKFVKHPVIVLSGDAGTNRGQALEYLAAVLGGKTENIGFLMRVLAYYLIEEHPGLVAEIDESVSRKDKEGLNKLLEEKIVPYVADFLGEKARVKIAKDPWLIRNASGEWIDSAASGKRGQLSLRNRIKEKTNSDEYMRFFYAFSNHPEIKRIVDEFVLDDGMKAMVEGTANCVVIKSTDLWLREKFRQNQRGVEVLNVFLHAPLAERAKNVIYWSSEDILERDRLKADTEVSLREKQEEADMSLSITNKTGRQIGDIIIAYLISGGTILAPAPELSYLPTVDMGKDYERSVVFFPELAI